jgi:hypothetical protein
VGGTDRIILEEDASSQFYSVPSFSADGGLIYGLVRKREGTSGLRGGAATLGLRRRPGEFLLSPTSSSDILHAREKRVKLAPRFPQPEPVRFRTAGYDGSAPRDLRTIRGFDVSAVGSRAFWTRAAPLQVEKVTRGKVEWTEVSGYSELMLTDLLTGAEHRLDDRLRLGTRLSAGESGVFWSRLVPRSDDLRDLLYAHAETGEVLKLGRYDADETIGWSVEWQGKLYWIVFGGQFAPDRVMSADLNGANVRTIASLGQARKSAMPGRTLGIVDGRLYCVLAAGPEDRRGRDVPLFLARISPNRLKPVEILQSLPSNSGAFRFDRRHLYFVVPEVRRSPWDSLFDNHSHDSSFETLCRVPL